MTAVGFLFNHDAAHQVMHAAPAAFELARRYPDIAVSLLVTTEVEETAVHDAMRDYPDTPATVERLNVPAAAIRFDQLTGNAFLLKRIAALRTNRRRLAGFDMLAAPDKTSLVLKRWLGSDCPIMVHTFHGAGDRAGGFQGIGGFDVCLLPGRKYEDRLLAESRIRPGAYGVVGYAKLEKYGPLPAPKLFETERPTVLYAPHFDPKLSSWYGWGPNILENFAGRDDLNLIFAPHVLLFRRRWHISTEGGRPRRTPKIPQAAIEADNILIDPGSQASVDMTYTRAADIYLGDVSSQVYEFLYRPRPCIFLNRSRAAWRDNPDFRAWDTGEVVDRLEGLPAALERARSQPDLYREEQKCAFQEAFDLTDTPSAVRAADALAEFLDHAGRRPAKTGESASAASA